MPYKVRHTFLFSRIIHALFHSTKNLKLAVGQSSIESFLAVYHIHCTSLRKKTSEQRDMKFLYDGAILPIFGECLSRRRNVFESRKDRKFICGILTISPSIFSKRNSSMDK